MTERIEKLTLHTSYPVTIFIGKDNNKVTKKRGQEIGGKLPGWVVRAENQNQSS